jgi:hypothetical protein
MKQPFNDASTIEAAIVSDPIIVTQLELFDNRAA